MKKSEIIKNLGNADFQDFEVKTVYESGVSGVSLDAIARLRINADGTHEILMYSYYDENGELHDTEERDWDNWSIEQTFDIEIDC